MTTLVTLAVVSLILGLAAKYADFMNEHGLPEHFKGAGLLAGFLWGLAGIGMIVVSPLAGLTYIAHVLYWFLRVKLEYPNHALAGIMMVLGGFAFQGQFLYQYRLDLLGVFLAYTVTGYVQTYFKTRYPGTRKFWRLRLRIYAIPLLYSLYWWNIEPMIATGFGMIGCEFMNLIYRDYQEDVVDRNGNRLFMPPVPTAASGPLVRGSGRT